VFAHKGMPHVGGGCGLTLNRTEKKGEGVDVSDAGTNNMEQMSRAAVRVEVEAGGA
jgi:hypothetical protein